MYVVQWQVAVVDVVVIALVVLRAVVVVVVVVVVTGAENESLGWHSIY